MDRSGHTVTLPVDHYDKLLRESKQLGEFTNVNDVVIDKAVRLMEFFAHRIEVAGSTTDSMALASMIRNLSKDRVKLGNLLAD